MMIRVLFNEVDVLKKSDRHELWTSSGGTRSHPVTYRVIPFAYMYLIYALKPWAIRPLFLNLFLNE